ncbi:MAG: sigma factor-like helix-turn-helix DNA-binding protein [Granulosicoccus sp.]
MQAKLDHYLKNIANGDERALTLLYELVSSRLYGLQLRILKNQELAEIALQETFFKIWKIADTYPSDHITPMIWLNGIARHHALGMRPGLSGSSGISVKIPELNLDYLRKTAGEYSDTTADGEKIIRYLEGMSPDSRVCVVGVYCDGYTLEEMSQALDIPIDTIKRWIRSGLVNLRECH